ncbi:hypothetical protein B296_00006459 [Ensete ventricosum]|uniref:Uncharacterized protein n=1 Tax=Ensete ventricosum TaxID=4639 RepID=A0A426ZJA6_ENSVE|nr:hypothetical protein B296_00006459 [Ensete ventricosum]
MVPTGLVLGFLNNVVVVRFHCLDSLGSLLTSPTPVRVGNFRIRWYVDTTALSRLRVGRPMMALYADGSLTTINDTSRVFDLGSLPNVTGIVVAPKVFNLVLQVTTFLGVVTVFSVKAIISSFVASFGV